MVQAADYGGRQKEASLIIAPREPNVGGRIRSLRASQGLSLRLLAQRSGLSTNAISLIERGQNSPTVSSLHQLATALEVPITAFFEDVREQATVYVRREGRLRSDGGGISMESLGIGLPNQKLAPFLVTLRPGAGNTDAPISHSGEELVYVLAGEINYRVADESYRLRMGDSLLFEAGQPHSMANPGTLPADMVLVFEIGDGGPPTGQHIPGDTEEPTPAQAPLQAKEARR